MPVVTMPDGTAVMMPDQIDPALGARLRAFQTNYKPPAAAAPSQTFGNTLAGEGELAGSALANIPHAAGAAAVDLYRRITGGNTNAPEPKALSAINVPVGKAGQQLAGALSNMLPSGSTEPQQPDDTNIPEFSSGTQDVLRNTGQVGMDVASVAPAVGAGEMAVKGITGAVENAAARAAAIPAAVTKYGMQTGENNPVARNIAGSSARPAVTAHNQAIADPVLGAQAGVMPGTKLTPATLDAARELPNSVYQRAESSIPTGPLSPNAMQAVQGVGADDMIVHSPDTQATIDAQKARLLSGPLTGSQVVNAQRALRFNGFRNVGAQDPEQTALGQAQLKMSDALHQHMIDTLPANAPVSADQLQAARVALAQNHTIENSLGPNGSVDLSKLAKLHNDNPGMLSGPMADIAQFASDHPEVTRLPSDSERFNPSGLTKDVASIDLKKPISYVQPLFGALARRTLTGPKPDLAPPVTGLGGEFGPIDRTPQPPPGMTAAAPNAPAPAAAGPPGQIPLADLLSHGVEQPPAPALTAGPMGAPASEGIPFRQNSSFASGPLGLADDLAGPATQTQNNRDVPAVMSQGVPENIMQRSRPSGGPSMPVAHSPAFISNNASAESAASQEAINRGTKPLVEVDPDGNERPILRDVTQADVNPARGHLIVDKETGTIVNSGGMAPALARGLLNRWKSMQGALGGAF